LTGFYSKICLTKAATGNEDFVCTKLKAERVLAIRASYNLEPPRSSGG
jgi:hypothetical protein